MTGLDRRCLHHDPNDENGNVDDNRILSREGFREEAGIQTAQPGSELQNGDEPAGFGRIGGIVTHI